MFEIINLNVQYIKNYKMRHYFHLIMKYDRLMQVQK